MNQRFGFTLAELLISLAILGIIATFTIPKVLSVQADSKNASIAKEAIASMASAMELYGMSKQIDASFSPTMLTPYLNYVRLSTSSADKLDFPGSGVSSCSAVSPCAYLHNGAGLQFYANTLSGTSTTNFVWFLIDPDSASTNSPAGGGLEAALYYNGKVATWASLSPGSKSSLGTYNPDPDGDPAWFHWN